MHRIVGKYDEVYNDLDKIQSYSTGKRYLIEFLNGNPGNYRCTIKNINTFTRHKVLEDYEHGKIIVLSHNLFYLH